MGIATFRFKCPKCGHNKCRDTGCRIVCDKCNEWVRYWEDEDEKTDGNKEGGNNR